MRENIMKCRDKGGFLDRAKSIKTLFSKYLEKERFSNRLKDYTKRMKTYS